MHIQKTVSNLVGLLIPFPKIRRRVKQAIMRYDLSSELELIRFSRAKMRPNSVCLIETNNCHGEVLAGVIPLFEKAGYKNIDIIINSEVYKEQPFCRQSMTNIRVYKTEFNMVSRFIKCEKIKKYKNLFLMSSACYHIPDGTHEYSTLLPLFKRAGLRPYVVEHDLKDIQRFEEEDFLSGNRLITLGKFDIGCFVNPHEFGRVKLKEKNKTTTFITVGNLDPKRKNFHKLIETLKDLIKETDKFKVIIIGKGEAEKLPIDLRDYITFTGRLNFPSMYTQLEQADFFLPLLDAHNPLHDRYITSGVTGSAQLIYGFLKVPVIDKKFAKFYRFDDANSIIYDDDLKSGMLKAINMQPEQYIKLRTQLGKTADMISEESIKNLIGLMHNE